MGGGVYERGAYLVYLGELIHLLVHRNEIVPTDLPIH
jgi:hypothetical protein